MPVLMMENNIKTLFYSYYDILQCVPRLYILIGLHVIVLVCKSRFICIFRWISYSSVLECDY
jgi:hypothetical protein